MRLLLALLAFTVFVISLDKPLLTAFILGIDLVVFGSVGLAMVAFAVLSLSSGRL